jgi:hypothetical protein
LVLEGFRAREIGAISEFQKKFFDSLSEYPMFENPQVPKINQFGAKINKLIFYTGYPDKGSRKIFLELRTCANRFLVSENPHVPKINQFEEKNFREAYWACSPFKSLKSESLKVVVDHMM